MFVFYELYIPHSYISLNIKTCLALFVDIVVFFFRRLSYVKYLEHCNTVVAVSISRTTGDIVTVSHTSKY